MNGVGIGTSVGMGTIVGLRLVVPDAAAIDYVAHFLFYGLVSGLIFESFRLAFQKSPFTK